VIATCIGPYWVLSTAPVIVRAVVDWVLPPLALDLVVPPGLLLWVGVLALAEPLVLGAVDAGGVPVVTGAGEMPAARLDAAGWNLSASSAAMPASVPPRVKTARRNGLSLDLGGWLQNGLLGAAFADREPTA
jgi:hypothetical protein